MLGLWGALFKSTSTILAQNPINGTLQRIHKRLKTWSMQKLQKLPMVFLNQVWWYENVPLIMEFGVGIGPLGGGHSATNPAIFNQSDGTGEVVRIRR